MSSNENVMPLQDPMVTLENCRFCLMCTHVAPMGYITKLETYTPHGMAIIATSQPRDLIGWEAETAAIMFGEVDGGNSRAHCVFSQPFEESIASVRAGLVQQGLAPAGAVAAGQLLAQFGNPYAAQAPVPAQGEGDFALFVGDATAHLWPGALTAVLTLLERCGVEPVLVGNGRNNGVLAHSLGYPDVARALVQETLDEVAASGAKTLLVLSAGDAYAFRQGVQERLGLALPEGLEVVEVLEFLAENGPANEKPATSELPTAYVDPTHAVRVPQRHEVARHMARAVCAGDLVELFWRRDRAHPVGSTQLQFGDPRLAESLTRARLEDAQRSGAERLVSEDPATLYQLQRFAGAYGLEVSGLFELLAA